MYQNALLGKFASIHSLSKMEWYKNDLNDKLLYVHRGLQQLTTLNGYVIPIIFKDGLARLNIRQHTKNEPIKFPHVFLTFKLK
jgi:hypothetical protein